MIFERKVGLQIVEGQIERRDASKQPVYGEATQSWMDK
jgi:hypothetical protein